MKIAITSLAALTMLTLACTAPVGDGANDDAESSSSEALSGCYGSVSAKYAALGGAQSFLGEPVSLERVTGDRVGRSREYQHGAIYWSPSTCAWSVTGGILQEWGQLGWERGELGYPVSDEVNAPDDLGRVSYFQNGSIYWSSRSGAFAVSGFVRDRWLALGGVSSPLGYPTSDYVAGGTQAGIYGAQSFVNGAMYLTSLSDASKTYAVSGLIADYYDGHGGAFDPSGLGKPTSNEQSCPLIFGHHFPPYSRCQSFARGRIAWSPSLGAYAY